jgi:hypothetical protein
MAYSKGKVKSSGDKASPFFSRSEWETCQIFADAHYTVGFV